MEGESRSKKEEEREKRRRKKRGASGHVATANLKGAYDRSSAQVLLMRRKGTTRNGGG